jgi:hypothetical protein
MNTKELMTKPDDQLTDYERMRKYGMGGDPLVLKPIIEQAIAELKTDNAELCHMSVVQRTLRLLRGMANPRSVSEYVQEVFAQELEKVGLVMQEILQEWVDGPVAVQVSCAQDWIALRDSLIYGAVQRLPDRYMHSVLEQIAAVKLQAVKEANQIPY